MPFKHGRKHRGQVGGGGGGGDNIKTIQSYFTVTGTLNLGMRLRLTNSETRTCRNIRGSKINTEVLIVLESEVFFFTYEHFMLEKLSE